MAAHVPSEAVERIIYEALITKAIGELDVVITRKGPPAFEARHAPVKRRAVRIKGELVRLLDDLHSGIRIDESVESFRTRRQVS